MEKVAPLGPAYQAGTMAGNPASMSSGIACLEVLQEEGIYDELDRLGARLEDGILKLAEKHNQSITINRLKGALTVYFTNETITNYEQAEQSSSEQFAVFFREMLKRGINLAPSKYEAWFLTIAHTDEDIERTLVAVDETFAVMKAEN